MRKFFAMTMFVCVLAITALHAQQTLIYTNDDVLFNQGRELFNQRKYAASYRSFEDFLRNTDKTKAGQIQEAEYYMAANAYELRSDDAEIRLKAYLLKHPYTPFFDKTQLMLGMLEYEKKDYKAALAYFNQVNDKRLGKDERVSFLFFKGYSNLETKNYVAARNIFKELKDMNTRYDLSATYYYAYSEYTLKNYAAALPEFLKIENNPAYVNIVPYYIIQIYYAQKNFDQLYARAEQLLKNNPNNPNNAEIYRIMGEIAYDQKNYAKAIENFKKYESISPQVLRNNMYQLGLSYFQLADFQNAVNYLSKTTTENDEMTENAYLHLGNAYVKLNDKVNARLAFEQATKTKFNASVREEALFNYALTTYETTTAFGESITAFDQFINEFPNSKHINKAYDYLATVFMTTKNYEAAYQSIQKIKNPTPRLLEARQFLLYQLGTEAFIQNNFAKAIEYFTLSLQSSTTGKYSAESYFWRSESYFRTGDNAKSIADLRSFFNNPQSRNSVNARIANYSMAYALFSQKNYNEALTWFNRYISAETNTQATTYADALNRAGDCYFYNRDFARAEQMYARATAASPNTGDYALFQSAYVAGLQRNYSTKISRLENLISTYPNSEYVDDALYEMGRAYIMLNNESRAISTFQRLLDTQPNSAMARKAGLEIGMTYANQGNNTQAISAYKNVISKYPGTPESYVALESLEAIYIEINDVAAYLAYTRTLNMKINTGGGNREDSISYIAAERQYMNANYAQAITGLRAYIQQFCAGGKYCTNAQYYIADSYYRLNDKAAALTAFQALLLIPGNQFIEEATMRAAEITYDRKEYQSSLQYFKQLQNIAQGTENRNIARLGVLRCSYFLNDQQTTISIANEIMNDARSNAELRTEAQYNRGKAYLAMGNVAQATVDFKALSTDTRTASGAEAKFLLANIYFEQGRLDDAENEVMSFTRMNTPHQYWLARSFIVLADVYIRRSNDFQAKQYLLSLQRNYTVNDDVQVMITDRLNAIAARENSRIVN